VPGLDWLAPAWLLLLPVAVAAGWLDSRGAATGARRAGAVARGLLLTLLVLGLARPVLRPTAPRALTVHLLDVSDSIDPEAGARRLADLEGLRAASSTEDAVRVIVFGDGVRAVGAGEGIGAAADAVRGPASDLGAALDLAAALLPPAGDASVVVHSDGHGTAPAATATLAAAGAAVSAQPLAPSARDPAVVGLTAPTLPLAPGATLALELTVAAGSAPLDGRVEARLGDRVLAEQPVSAPAGATTPLALELTLPDDIPPGLATLTLSVAGDTLDVGVHVRRPPVVWVVGSGGAGRALAQVLRAEQLSVEERPPGSLADLAPDALEAVDLVVVAGASTAPGPDRPAALPPRFTAALDPYVRGGGGLLTLGGEFAYDQGDWDRSPLAALLPVRMDPQAEEEDGTVTLVIALDKSGSMAQSASAPTSTGAAVAGIGARLGASARDGSKMQVVARATIAAIQLLKPEDQVGVLAVDTQPDWAVAVQPAARRVALMEQVLAIGAGGGGIFVTDALKAARVGLQQGDTRLRHLILFADTADAAQQADPVTGEPAEALVERMVAEDGITVSIIGVGQSTDRDVAFLKRLAARGNGRFAQTEDVRGLETLFVAETQEMLGQGLAEDQPVRPRRVGLHPAIAGIDWARSPALGGMNKVSRAPRARTLVEGAADRPLLATHRVGQGQVAAWTSDAGGRWARAFARWEGSDRLWTQLARSLARPDGGAAGLDLVVERGRVLATSRGPDGLSVPRPGLDLVAVTEDGEAPLAHTLDAPGQWSAPLSVAEGVAFSVEARSASGAVLASRAGLGAPSPERTARTVNTAALDRLTQPAGPRPPHRDRLPLAVWLLAGAALLLPVEAWLRR